MLLQFMSSQVFISLDIKYFQESEQTVYVGITGPSGIENDWKTSKFLISNIKGAKTPWHMDSYVDYSKYS